jgi:hypothetical protein
MVKRTLFSLALLALSASAFADGEGTSAATTLELDGAARPMAMGGAFTAVADDPCAVFYNPAGLTQQRGAAAMFTHTMYFSGINSEYMALAGDGSGGWNWGAGANFLFTNDIAGYDEYGNPTGNFGASEGFAALDGAVALSERTSIGAGAKYVRQSIDAVSASALAGDAGILWRNGPLRLGGAVQNVGQKITLGSTAFALPLALAGGASYKLPFPMTLSAEYKHYNDGNAGVHVGGEYALAQLIGVGDVFYLRGGYQGGRSDNTGSGFAAGVGFELGAWKLDYAFSPWGDLGNVQRITLGINFGNPGNAAERVEHQNDDQSDQQPQPKKREHKTAPTQDSDYMIM